MSLRARVTCFTVAAMTGLATAADVGPAPVLPGNFRWVNPPRMPAVQVAWVLGGEKDASPYLLRVRLAAGGRITPHAHPDTRSTTVLSGTLYVAFGTVFDETRLVAVPEGAVYVAPANVSHFLMARDGDVVYQEAGVGPTGTVLSASSERDQGASGR